MSKFVSAKEAAALVNDHMTLALGGFTSFGAAETLNTALQTRYRETKSPRDLTVFHVAATGDKAEGGANHLGEAGLIKRFIGGHIGMEPRINELVVHNQCEAFLIPQGVCSNLTRAIAGKKPGVLTRIGLKTYADPRLEGCRGNQAAIDGGYEVVQVLPVNGKDYLFYKTFPIDICFLKGTYADEDGNISLMGEANISEQFEIAAATHNSGGIVIFEVERILKRGSIPSREITVHHFMVDYVVEGDPAMSHQSTGYPEHRPELCGEYNIPVGSIAPPKFDIRKVAARRCALEAHRGILLNLGVGVPDMVGQIITEEGYDSEEIFTLSIESGVLGGVSQGGILLGSSINAAAFYREADIFDVYDGGGIDMSCLGAAEIDRLGNVNVSKFGGRVVGPGGFVNISQNAKKLCFCGTFTAGKSDIRIEDGRLNIVEDGPHVKFKKDVEQVSFSGELGSESGQEVFFVTERAVFKLIQGGIELIEIAPGVDLYRDVLGKMEFEPKISPNLKLMDQRLFRPEKMGLVL